MTSSTEGIRIFSRGELTFPRKVGYRFMPQRALRRGFGRTITQYTAQLSAWYHAQNCRAMTQGKQPMISARPVMIIDYNRQLRSAEHPIKISIVSFEGGYGFFQIGKGPVRAYLIDIVHMPDSEFGTWDYEQEVILLFRRALRSR